ncbi:MAG: LCP family protein [Bacillota bacterium]
MSYEPDNQISRTSQKLFVAAVLVFLVFVSSFSGYLFAAHWFGAGAAHGDDGNQTANKKGFSLLPGKEDNIERILVIGIDERVGEPSRADTIILAIVNTTKNEVNLLSIPRDTYVNIPGRGMDKMNHAQAYGGAKLLMQSVSSLLNTEVDKYVQLNFNGFKEVVNILGGLEYNVEMRMYYPDENIDLYPGVQKLNGDKALQYVRFREEVRADIGRIERQQRFITEFIQHALQPKHILKIPELVGEAYRSIKTNISLMDMVALARAMKDLESDKLTTKMLPGEPKYINGVSYWIPSTSNLDVIFPQQAEKVEEKQ